MSKLLEPRWLDSLLGRYAGMAPGWKAVLALPLFLVMCAYYTTVYFLAVGAPIMAVLFPLAFVARSLQRLNRLGGECSRAAVGARALLVTPAPQWRT